MIYGLSHKKAALVVIDVQQEYFKAGGPAAFESAPGILENVNRLIGGFREAGAPVVFVRHMHREDGSDAGRMGDFSSPEDESSFVEGTPEVELHPDLDYRLDDIVVIKRRYSAFTGTDLEAVLRTAGTRAIVLCGMMTSFCCETTARDGHGRDYEVLFVADAVAGPDLEDSNGAKVSHLEVMKSTTTALAAGFAEIVSTDDVLDRLG